MDRGAWDPTPWGPKESDMTELLTLLFYFFIYGNIFIVSFSSEPVCKLCLLRKLSLLSKFTLFINTFLYSVYFIKL